MLSLPSTVRIFVCTQPADMRRSFDGLAMLVEQVIGADPLAGHLFVFSNRRGDRIKLLYWDRDGYAIWYKRLEEGMFTLPTTQEDQGASIELTWSQFMMWLDGVDWTRVRRQRRYIRQPA